MHSLLAQAYDDTGGASRWAIIIGALAFPCLVIIAVVRQKFKHAEENDRHIERLNQKIEELEGENSKKPSIGVSSSSQNLKISSAGLTKAQQAHIDEVLARAGKPSLKLQREIDQICAAKTQGELSEIFLRGSNIERPAVEAELLCAVMLAKQAELTPNINAENLKEEQRARPAPDRKFVGLCPKCESEVLESSTGYFCQNQECFFKFNGVIMGQLLSSAQVTKLLQDGRTDLLSEFVSKEGRHFSAFLVVDKSGKLTFDFPNANAQ